MPADRPLRNLTREHLLGIYTDLQSEPSSKKYNLRKELQTDKRENTVYANRWLTRDQFLELAGQELQARGLELPATVPDERGGAPAEVAATAPAGAPTPEASAPPASAAASTPQAPLGGVTSGAVAEGIAGADGSAC